MDTLEKKSNKDQKRVAIVSYLKELRKHIINAFEGIEVSGVFKYKSWKNSSGGGGDIAKLEGSVFEKAAVNWSEVWGEHYPLDKDKGPFYATGISLITHMSNPHAPTVHMNVRYIEVGDECWLGGGFDLTPMGFPYKEDTLHFHKVAKDTLDPFGKELYPKYSQEAREYFYIPHREKERGVGGIFFDYLHGEDFSKDMKLWKGIGSSLIEAIMPIYQRRIHQSFSDQEKEEQLKLRGHYVEFNLLYDRGTKFGFQSGGNSEAILCSMPPLVRW